MTGVAAVVLAAGGSRRMGRPKQLLLFNERSLLQHAVDVAATAGCDPVVVVLGANAERLKVELVETGAVVVLNADWEQGPGTSVRAGMEAVGDADAVVFLVCDQPFVTPDHVRELVAAQRLSGRPMAASGYAGACGVPALFTRDCFAALQGLAPHAGAKQLLMGRPDDLAVVPFPDGAFDIDTPADYARWRPDPEPSFTE